MQINQSVIATRQGVRATWAEVNLVRLEQNLAAIKEYAAPAKVMLIVKANAYGHGLAEVSKALAGKTDYVGVAVLEEGILLRNLGITEPIIVLGGIWRDQIPQYLHHNLTLTASSVERLDQIDAIAAQKGVQARVHLKIDTGMERIGIHYYSAHLLQEAALKCRNVVVEGVFSHFANADSADLSHARLQLERFNEVLRFYERRSLPMPIRHIANSAAILQLPESRLDMVRPGILLYGVYPSPEVPRTVVVKPALTWKSRVVYFKVVKPGHAVSYGSTWQPDHEVRVVTVPVGYGDGYFRSMSNRAKAIIRGKKYPQVGSICMDQLMINIEWDSAFNGDEVILLGEADGERITVEDLAEWAGTVPYEILTNINTRVPRIYTTNPKRKHMPKSAEDILKTAILLELRGKAFYTTSARETRSEAVRKIFSMMAEEEDEHIAFLSRQFAEYEKSGRFIQNATLAHADDTEALMILSENVKKEISAAGFEAAAISAAIDFENRAVEVYQGRANEATDPNEKEMYQLLADWERTHFRLLHKLDEDLKEQVWQDNNFWPF